MRSTPKGPAVLSETINMIDREKKCVCIKRLRVIMIVLSLLSASLSLSLSLSLGLSLLNACATKNIAWWMEWRGGGLGAGVSSNSKGC